MAGSDSRYEVLFHLASGGMAELYVSRVRGIQGFEKIVALKKILPRLAANSEFVELFLQEARLAATLDHPNIVHVHDVGQDGGEYFFAMEYVNGADVRSILGRATERQR